MEKSGARGGSFQDLKPFQAVGPGITNFPVYKNLDEQLRRSPAGYDRMVAHICAVLSGWAYADPNVVATMMVRMGLEYNRCRYIGLINDSMFICSKAYFVQSRDGRVGLLVYRGTEPVNLISWLTDADVNPITIPVDPPSSESVAAIASPGRSDDVARLHGGFYRNQRATWFDVEHTLRLALEGKSILEDVDEVEENRNRVRRDDLDVGIRPLEVLYITGHSLGGAMAAMAAFRIAHGPEFASVLNKVKAVYTYGQPMIGNAAWARLAARYPLLNERLFRHVYDHDVVPALPPKAAGDFAHMGVEFRAEHRTTSAGDRPTWVKNTGRPVQQLPSVWDLAGAFMAFVHKQLPRWFESASAKFLELFYGRDRSYSIYDHLPPNYILTSQPPDVLTEFGDF
jgi:hypothetical protein